MDALISAAGRSLALGDPLAALKHVALREDAPALALRGIAMAQLGEFATAKTLLGRAASAFGEREPVARARCLVAHAEIALVLRDLGKPLGLLERARMTLDAHGDHANAAHAGYLQARYLLLIGRLGEAEAVLDALAPEALQASSRVGVLLVAAGLAMRRITAAPARSALERAATLAEQIGIAPLIAEVATAIGTFEAPAARLLARGEARMLDLGQVETLIGSGALIVDAARNGVRAGDVTIPLGGRPILFALARTLAEAWPGDVSRETLLAQAVGARQADESHRARLRVDIGRLRSELKAIAEIAATKRGFALRPLQTREVAVLTPPREDPHADVLALLADGEAWSSSALALALDVSPRTTQRALETLAAAGKVVAVGQGRAHRWIANQTPGFPTSLLLPAVLRAG